jgi:hypothetical protein
VVEGGWLRVEAPPLCKVLVYIPLVQVQALIVQGLCGLYGPGGGLSQGAPAPERGALGGLQGRAGTPHLVPRLRQGAAVVAARRTGCPAPHRRQVLAQYQPSHTT